MGKLPAFKSFVPMPEVLVVDLGRQAAAVFGVIWRYCNLRDGVCWASHKTLAEKIGVSTKTVQRWVTTLIDCGYLRDVTQPGSSGTRSYVVTDRVYKMESWLGVGLEGVGNDVRSTEEQGNQEPRDYGQAVQGGRTGSPEATAWESTEDSTQDSRKDSTLFYASRDACERVCSLSEESETLSRREEAGYERLVRYVREYANEHAARALDLQVNVIAGFEDFPPLPLDDSRALKRWAHGLAKLDRAVEGYHEYVESAYDKMMIDQMIMKDPHSLVAVAADMYRRDRV